MDFDQKIYNAFSFVIKNTEFLKEQRKDLVNCIFEFEKIVRSELISNKDKKLVNKIQTKLQKHNIPFDFTEQISKLVFEQYFGFVKSTAICFNYSFLETERIRTEHQLTRFQNVINFLTENEYNDNYSNILLNQSQLRKQESILKLQLNIQTKLQLDNEMETEFKLIDLSGNRFKMQGTLKLYILTKCSKQQKKEMTQRIADLQEGLRLFDQCNIQFQELFDEVELIIDETNDMIEDAEQQKLNDFPDYIQNSLHRNCNNILMEISDIYEKSKQTIEKMVKRQLKDNQQVTKIDISRFSRKQKKITDKSIDSTKQQIEVLLHQQEETQDIIDQLANNDSIVNKSKPAEITQQQKEIKQQHSQPAATVTFVESDVNIIYNQSIQSVTKINDQCHQNDTYIKDNKYIVEQQVSSNIYRYENLIDISDHLKISNHLDNINSKRNVIEQIYNVKQKLYDYVRNLCSEEFKPLRDRYLKQYQAVKKCDETDIYHMISKSGCIVKTLQDCLQNQKDNQRLIAVFIDILVLNLRVIEIRIFEQRYYKELNKSTDHSCLKESYKETIKKQHFYNHYTAVKQMICLIFQISRMIKQYKQQVANSTFCDIQVVLGILIGLYKEQQIKLEEIADI